MLERADALRRLERAFKSHPAAALEGPRQSGKTTLARAFMQRERLCTFFDLEKAVDRRRLQTPEQTLGGLLGLVVLDEIQRMPELFEVLRVLLDRPKNPARFLLLGSASPALVRGVSETLAGRVGLVALRDSTFGRRGRRRCGRSGFAAAFRDPSSHPTTMPPRPGGRVFCRPSSNAISPNSAFGFPPKRSGASGR